MFYFRLATSTKINYLSLWRLGGKTDGGLSRVRYARHRTSPKGLDQGSFVVGGWGSFRQAPTAEFTTIPNENTAVAIPMIHVSVFESVLFARPRAISVSMTATNIISASIPIVISNQVLRTASAQRDFLPFLPPPKFSLFIHHNQLLVNPSKLCIKSAVIIHRYCRKKLDKK